MTTSAPESATSATGTSCVVGAWRTVTLDVSAATELSMTGHGGAGIRLGVAPDGAATVDFTGMAPVEFSGRSGVVDAVGSFTYAGTASGQIRLPPAGQRSGAWAPGSGSVAFDRVSATIRLTAPIHRTIADVRLADLVGAAGLGGAIDVAPLLGAGTYTCDGDRLILGPPADGPLKGTWILEHAR